MLRLTSLETACFVLFNPGLLKLGLYLTGLTSLDGSHQTSTNIRNQVRKSIHPAKPRPSLQPGSVLILLAGRFRGKRVILLKHLPQGILLVTGPFKINGVPLRRVNARYVIATSLKVELKGIDEKTVENVGEEGYFTREKKQEKKGEGAFFKQGEKPEVGFRTRTGWVNEFEEWLADSATTRRRRKSPACAPTTRKLWTRHYCPTSRRSRT